MIGTRLGHYEILDSLGAGGMGEVYRASDTRLKRQVAIKVLPASVTGDSDRLARFQREAEVLASLNHPNIAHMYGIEGNALVMELVEGEDLSRRIARGPIPIAEALPIAKQIAEALAAAHEAGIVHRDLKPANVKVRDDGTVKVLDFGLAKPQDRTAPDSQDPSKSPTITSPVMTVHGVILGTAAYMSPEQAAGKPVDRRTDLWAFGVVLFEMLTGRRLFDGESVSHVIAAVLKDEPDWAGLPADTPASVRKLLGRCLEKDRRKRLSDASTAALECEDALVPVRDVAAPSRPAFSGLLAVAGGVAIGAVAVWLVTGSTRSSAPPAPAATKFAIELPADQVLTRSGRHVLALSPDGRQLVFVANNQLNVRSLGDLSTRVIEGTVNVDPGEPTFSPDGEWLAFWTNGVLKKIPFGGGTAIALTEVGIPYGMSWHGERLLLALDSPRAIVDVPAGGGSPKPLINLDAAKAEYAQSPQLIDDGRAVLFTLRTGERGWDTASVVVHDLQTGARTTVIDRGTDGRLLASGHLAYTRDATVYVAQYDAGQRAITGTAAPLQQRILQSVGGFTGASMVVFAGAGTMAYVPDETYGSNRALMWMARDGKTERIDLPERPHWPAWSGLTLSPDGKRVAMRLMGASGSQTDIWIADLVRKTFTRLSFTGTATDPVWTPDGTQVCYEDKEALLCQPFDGSAPQPPLFHRAGMSRVTGLSPDGGSVLLTIISPKTGFDLWLASNKPPFEARPIVAIQGADTSASVSPDGRWIAYSSEESGIDEIYVRPFPAVEQGRWQVSTTGGLSPRFSRDSRELYYFTTRSAGTSTTLTLMAVKIQAGSAFGASSPEVVAPLPFGVRGYDVAADGRFIISAPVAVNGASGGVLRQSIVVVENWPSLLRSGLAATSPQ